MRHQALSVADRTVADGMSSLVPTISHEITAQRPVIVIIDHRILIRECISRCIGDFKSGRNIVGFNSVAEWQASECVQEASIVLLCTQGRFVTGKETKELIREIKSVAPAVPVIMISDADDFEHVSDALNRGAQGYIPTDVTLEVAVCAMELVQAGGTYVPASTLQAVRKSQAGDVKTETQELFTDRQVAVVMALRQGKANKIIAYELNMCESTVKVHVRNIMKKLKAKNRTQVAYLANELFPIDKHR